MTQGLPPQARRPGRDEGWDAVPPARWARLWEAVGPAAAGHALDPGALGEYAVLLHRRGAAAAGQAFPAVAAHLAAGCARCAADLQELLAFAAEEPGAAQAAERDPRIAAGGGLRRILASRFTPLRGAQSAGQRGAAGVAPAPPPLTFQTDDVTIVLRVERETRRDTVSVSGFVVPHRGESSSLWGGEARLVALAAPGGPSGGASAERLDERGGFVLEGVAPGAYRLELRSADEVVVVEDLQIGHAQDPPSPPRA